jgi:OOP family OmpA-OmpF porin
MLKIAGQKVFVGLVAGTLLNIAVPVWAGDKDAGYVLDSSDKPVLSAEGCVLAPSQPKDKLFDACGDGGDSDGDGVPDDKDKCPNTPKGVKVDANGCPADSDGDGVPDYLDACPNNTAEEISKGVDAKGCPLDSDGDGVPDFRDKCPDTPAELISKVDADGCAPVDVVRLELTSVFFDFDKAELKEGGKTALEALAKQIISNDANVGKVEIVGHTDYIGDAAYNQKLSERRAKAAANYLISQGVAANKVTAVGKGEAEAKQNASKAERAKDRKVIVDVHRVK